MAVSVPRFTVDELDDFPDDGNRYELLDGLLLVTPSPRVAHQVVANRLQVQISNALAGSGMAHVVGPGAISVPPSTQLQPDVLVYPGRFGPTTDWANVTGHWLAVEILSRPSRVYDRRFKRAAYFALGVHQVWLVDLEDLSVDVWTSSATRNTVRDVIQWETPGAGVVTLSLAEVFDGLR